MHYDFVRSWTKLFFSNYFVWLLWWEEIEMMLLKYNKTDGWAYPNVYLKDPIPRHKHLLSFPNQFCQNDTFHSTKEHVSIRPFLIIVRYNIRSVTEPQVVNVSLCISDPIRHRSYDRSSLYSWAQMRLCVLYNMTLADIRKGHFAAAYQW